MSEPASRHAPPPPDGKTYWLEKPGSVRKIWLGLIGVCVVLFLADFFVDKHPHFDIENVPNFYGFYGFVGCVFLVLSAAQLRKVLMREEDYYEKRDAAHGARADREGASDDAAPVSDGNGPEGDAH